MADKPDKRAVIIGVNEYAKDSGIPSLKGAVCDATEMRDRLRDSGGFSIEHFLINGDATCAAIRKAMSDLLWNTDASTVSLFYFSGHGLHDEYGNGFIAPHDVHVEEPLVCGIRMQELTQLLLAAKNKKAALVILDCCYSGVAAGDSAKSGPVAQEPPLKDWFAAVQGEGVGEGRIVLASSGKDQKSRERPGCVHEVGTWTPHDHGAFTFHLLEGIDGKATDTNGAVTLQQLCTFVNKQMEDDPHHKMSFFGSSLTQAQKITLARPRQWTSDQQLLAEARERLLDTDPLSVFVAATDVSTVLARSPNLTVACDVRNEINIRLQDYKNPAILWLNGKMVKLFEFRQSVSRLKALVGNLTVQTYVAEKESMQGLLVSLCQMTFGNPTPEDEASFIRDLRAHASSERSPTTVGKPQAEGQKLT